MPTTAPVWAAIIFTQFRATQEHFTRLIEDSRLAA